MNLGTLILSLCRLDRSPCPAWFQRILDLDSTSKAYWSTVMGAHTHDNPVMTCFIDTLWESIEATKQKRALAASKQDSGHPQVELSDVSEQDSSKHNPSVKNTVCVTMPAHPEEVRKRATGE